MELVFLHEDEVTEFCTDKNAPSDLMLVIPLCYDIIIDKCTDCPSNTAVHLLQHSYMFQSTYRKISRLSETS